MMELEKKQSGEFYDTRDAQIRAAHDRAKELMKRYNDVPASDAEEREKLLRTMLGSFGENCRINQPFYIDYGTNIYLGDNAFINLNCTLLDTGEITIGESTLLGPDVKIYTAVHETKWTERFWFQEDKAIAIKTRTEPRQGGCDQNKNRTGAYREIRVDRRRDSDPSRRDDRRLCSDRSRKRSNKFNTRESSRFWKSLPCTSLFRCH